jgi:hypothetical protein
LTNISGCHQDRPFPTDADHDRGANPYVRGESEPLAHLAQLYGVASPLTPLAGHPWITGEREHIRAVEDGVRAAISYHRSENGLLRSR